MSRTYSDLKQMSTFDERFNYLMLHGRVGEPTFGSERYMNQKFYRSREWKHIRDYVIERDGGFDLGCPDVPIPGRIMVHHMCPLSPESLENSDITILDPNYLISCSILTHNAIHYGDQSILKLPVERHPGDTCLWTPISK